MRLRGTMEGQQLYPNEKTMEANAHGQPTFKFAEQLSAQHIKVYAAMPRPKLLKQLETLLKKEAKLAVQRADEAANPERVRVKALSANALKAELRQRGLNAKGAKEVLHVRLLDHLRGEEEEGG